MRIPLPLPASQTFNQGIGQGINLQNALAQQALMRQRLQLAQQEDLMKQPLIAAQTKLAQSQASAATQKQEMMKQYLQRLGMLPAAQQQQGADTQTQLPPMDIRAPNLQNQMPQQSMDMPQQPVAQVTGASPATTSTDAIGSGIPGLTEQQAQFAISPVGQAMASYVGMPAYHIQQTPQQKLAYEQELLKQKSISQKDVNQQKAIDLANAQENKKRLDDIYTSAPNFIQAIENYNKMIDIVNRKPSYFHPWGISATGQGELGTPFNFISGELATKFYNDADVGDFQAAQRDIATAATKQINSRGTNFEFKTNLAYKPSFNDNPEKAKGKIRHGLNQSAQTLQQMIDLHKRLTGQPFMDYSYPGGLKLVEAPDGRILLMSKEEFDRRSKGEK